MAVFEASRSEKKWRFLGPNVDFLDKNGAHPLAHQALETAILSRSATATLGEFRLGLGRGWVS